MNSVKTCLLTSVLVLTLSKNCSIEAQDVPVLKQRAAIPEKPIFEASHSLKLALEALDNQHWKIRDAKYKIKLNPSEDGWRIVVTFLPETPGAEAYISVKNDGSVKVVPGL